ncbi:MAG: polysaccharide lyase [Cyanobacteria bacterium J06626_18]
MLGDIFSPTVDGAVLVGDVGDNRLTGTDLNDHLSGLDGSDRLRGLDGMDLLEGDLSDDKLDGGTGDDALVGGVGEDKLFGGDDNDWLSGDEDKDLLKGDEGDDTLIGGDGTDTLKGGDGDDLINGGLHNDAVYLGDGSDVVVLAPGNGYDSIKDFELGTDKMRLESLTFDELELVAQSGDEAVIRINKPGHLNDGENLAKFEGIRADQFGTDDFLFADGPPSGSDGPFVPEDEPSPGTDVDPETPTDTPAPGTEFWADSFASPNWMDRWDVRSGKSWGFENMELISESQGQSSFLRVSYPAGSASPSVSRKERVPLGGAQFYADLSLPPQDELRLSYDVRFADNFDFVKGGKLPGLFGGEGASGGNIPDGTDGFSTRLMWRREGDGEVYAYLPTSEGYGTSIGRGSWQFEPDTWYRIEQEVVLNQPDQSDGQIRLWVNDELVVDQRDLQFRTTDSLQIDGVFFSTFFGGGDSSWATPNDVHIDFDNFSVAAVA